MSDLTLIEATRIVLKERAENADEGDTPREIIEHVRNVLALPGQGGTGAWEIEDFSDESGPDESYPAYVAVLSATDEEIEAALVELENAAYRALTQQDAAIELIRAYGRIDGAQHKDWVLGRVLETLGAPNIFPNAIAP